MKSMESLGTSRRACVSVIRHAGPEGTGASPPETTSSLSGGSCRSKDLRACSSATESLCELRTTSKPADASGAIVMGRGAVAHDHEASIMCGVRSGETHNRKHTIARSRPKNGCRQLVR